MSRLSRLVAAVIIAAPQAALAQTLGQGVENEIAWWRVFGALLLCLALGVGGALALRARMGGQTPAWRGLRLGRGLPPTVSRRLSIVESLRVSPQVNVSLIRCDGAEFLVAASPQGVAITPVQGPEGA